eukprot:jgi/Mesvir1/23069/Mv16067-RA.1
MSEGRLTSLGQFLKTAGLQISEGSSDSDMGSMLCKAITLEMKKPPVATGGKGKTGPARGERTRKDPPSNGTDEEEEDATSSEDFLDAREQLAPAAARAKGKKSQGRNRKLAENAAFWRASASSSERTPTARAEAVAGAGVALGRAATSPGSDVGMAGAVLRSPRGVGIAPASVARSGSGPAAGARVGTPPSGARVDRGSV